jgi:hypothetical protein
MSFLGYELTFLNPFQRKFPFYHWKLFDFCIHAIVVLQDSSLFFLVVDFLDGTTKGLDRWCDVNNTGI